jgi:FAD/FMN-containing dehydrogenase
MSRRTDPIFEEFERIMLRYGGRPHLGKKVYLDRQQMDELFGEDTMERFRAARRSQDPSGKFLNDFTERLLGD